MALTKTLVAFILAVGFSLAHADETPPISMFMAANIAGDAPAAAAMQPFQEQLREATARGDVEGAIAVADAMGRAGAAAGLAATLAAYRALYAQYLLEQMH